MMSLISWQDGWLAHTGDAAFCFLRPIQLGPRLIFTLCSLIWAALTPALGLVVTWVVS